MIRLILIFFFYVFCKSTNAQNIYFPDANLKEKLLQSAVGNDVAGSSYDINGGSLFNTLKIDSNNDGDIQISETVNVRWLKLPNSSISDLTGLEYFTNLGSLQISGNLLITYNFTLFPQLEILLIGSCQLSNINLTGLLNLKRLECPANQLLSIDFSDLSSLEYVYCGYNQLTSLDFTNNPLFNMLVSFYNPQLASIKLKNGATQVFPNNLAYCLFDGNPNLTYICADAAEIPVILAFQATCAINQVCVIDSACSLSTVGFEDDAVSIAPNPSGGFVTVTLSRSDDTMDTIELIDSLGKSILKLEKINVENQIIDCSSFAKGLYFIKIITTNGSIQSKKLIVN